MGMTWPSEGSKVMIVYKLDLENDIHEVTATGAVKGVDLVQAPILFACAIFDRLYLKDPTSAAAFRELLTAAVNDEDSPLWMPPDEKSRQLVEMEAAGNDAE